MGEIAGAIIAIMFLSWLLDWGIFRRAIDGENMRIAVATMAAVVVAVILYGFGNADGGPWDPGAGVITYPIGGVVVAGLRYWGARRRADRPEPSPEWHERKD
jgi:hypothetical protein